MFVMTSEIWIGGRAVKASGVQYKLSVSNHIETCVLTLPLAPYVKSRDKGTDTGADAEMRQRRSCEFGYGDTVSVRLGYNGETNEVFKGFVHRVNYGEQLKLECEGYAWQLRDKMLNKSYQKTSARAILSDTVSGTDIQLSSAIDDVPLEKVTFKNTPRLKVLEWLQKECAMKVWMDGEWLYAGASKYAVVNPEYGQREVKIRVGWNVVSADELKKVEKENVQINIVSKSTKGEVKKTKGEVKKYSSSKEVKVREGLGEAYLAKAAKAMQEDENYRGYEGSVTLFGVPLVRKSDKVIVTDERFPERSGTYFAEEVEGTFDNGGYRQKVKLKRYGGN